MLLISVITLYLSIYVLPQPSISFHLQNTCSSFSVSYCSFHFLHVLFLPFVCLLLYYLVFFVLSLRPLSFFFSSHVLQILTDLLVSSQLIFFHYPFFSTVLYSIFFMSNTSSKIVAKTTFYKGKLVKTFNMIKDKRRAVE